MSGRGNFIPRGRGGGGGSFRGGRGGGFGPGGDRPGAAPELPMPKATEHELLVKQRLAEGTVGRPIALMANFYKLDFYDHVIYQYHVGITRMKSEEEIQAEEVAQQALATTATTGSDNGSNSNGQTNLDRFLKRFGTSIVEQFITDHAESLFKRAKPVYDGGKSLYTIEALDLPIDANRLVVPVTIDVDGKPSVFRLQLHLVNRIKLEEAFDFYEGKRGNLPEGVVHAFEMVYREVMSQAYVPYQRKFFDLDAVERSSGRGPSIVNFAPGFIPSVRMTEFGLALNLHLKTSCVLPPSLSTVLDFAGAVANIRPGVKYTSGQVQEASKMLRHLRMYTQHSSRKITYTIESLIDRTPYQYSIKRVEDQAAITIAQYFLDTYGLKVHALPLVRTTGKYIRYLPLELCFLQPNQFLSNSKINSAIQRELLAKSTHTPNVYFNRLQAVVEKIATTNPELQEHFGLELTQKPVAFKGRILTPPKMLNAEPKASFFETKPAPAKWAVFCFDTTIAQDRLKNFVGQMIRQAKAFGLNFNTQPTIASFEVTCAREIYNAFYNLKEKTEAQFVLVAIPPSHPAMNPNSLYSLVKYNCDQQFGIISQCFQSGHINNTPNGYFDNLLLKVNGKLGGRNVAFDPNALKALPFDLDETMIIGIDVTHATDNLRRDQLGSSVAAAVGSTDAALQKYSASIRVQAKDREEIVRDLTAMIVELLVEYHKANKSYPKNLIVFRDGVSEGQFGPVKETELAMIREAAKKATGKEKTKVTMLVVQKRHHTRFVRQQVDASGRRPTFNVPSGTVVDHTIIEPMYKMFYLNSHFSRLGTSRPTKYVILQDDLKLGADDLQKLCFLVCHSCIRTRTVIAQPTPTRYAHLAAYRSKLHIEAQREIAVLKAEEEGGQEAAEAMRASFDETAIKRLNDWVKIHKDVQNQLYYC